MAFPLNLVQVKVKKRGDDRKFLANVLSIGVDCDVALLDVTDESFWEGARACSGVFVHLFVRSLAPSCIRSFSLSPCTLVAVLCVHLKTFLPV